MSRWEIERNQTTVETDLFDVEVTDAVNRFGRSATAWIEDDKGAKFDNYPRGTRVDFYVRSGFTPETLTVQSGETENVAAGTEETWREVNIAGEWNVAGEVNIGDTERDRMFAGFVVERRETDRAGADVLELDVYSFDHFLRRNIVGEDLSGGTISDALETVIDTYTPVEYTASNVEIVDDQTLTRSFRGSKVENVLSELATKSGDEQYGVRNDLEFFWQPRETGSAPRGIDNSQWIDYDIPEVGKESPNEITVFFDDGNQSVTVDRGGDKLALQDNIGTSSPPTFGEEVQYPNITNIEDARDKANEILTEREPTLTGTVTTFDLYDASPGDVIDVTIEPRGIDTQFRIAELTWRWGSDDVQVTIVEKRGDQDDMLVRMSDTLKDVEMRGADRDATANRVTRTNMTATVDMTGDADGEAITSGLITNACRNEIRDGWAGDGTLSVAEIAVGDGTADPSRTDDELANELERQSATQSLPDSRTARYTADFTATDVREVGLFATDGTLLARGLVGDATLSAPVTVTVDLTVDNDTTVENAVVTETGQTSVRDLIADNSPELPTDYAYGSDGADPAETDTALGNQLDTRELDEILVQSASDQADWEGITPTPGDTDPWEVSGGELTTLQSCFTQEGEDGNPTNTTDNTEYSGGSGALFLNLGDESTHTFTTEYTIPSSAFELAVRYDATGASTHTIEVTLDGETLGSFNVLLSPPEWLELIADSHISAPTDDLAPGQHTIGFESVNAEDNWVLDVLAPRDNRYGYTDDNDNGGSDGYLDGPELYPDQVRVEFANEQLRREYTTARAEQTWDDTSNDQYIELSNDDGSNWARGSNNSTFSNTFASASTQLRAAVGISRYGSRTTATPQTGFNAQAVDTHDLFAEISAIKPTAVGVDEVQSIVPPNVLDGETIAEAGQLETNGDLLTHAIFAELDILADERVISNERIAFSNPP